MSASQRNSRGQAARASSSTWDNSFHREPQSGLTRERIVAAGIALADRHGLDAVSIRRIAADLSSSPMALYYYVPSKRDLLNLILDAISAEFEWPVVPSADWRSTLSHFARETRRSLKRHPWASALRAADPEYGPECIRTLESLLTILSTSGLETRTATRALGVIFVFVNGFVAAETSHLAVHSSTAAGRMAPCPRFSRAVLASGKFPNVAHFFSMAAEVPDDEGFERSLNWILTGIEADLAAHAQTRSPKRLAVRRKKTA